MPEPFGKPHARTMLDFEELKKMLSKPKQARCTKMIDDPYARVSLKFSDRKRMEKEREMARQRKWIAKNDQRRKEKIQACRQALTDAEAQRERVQTRFIQLKDKVLVFLVTRSLHREKHRRRIQLERDRLAAADSFFHHEDPDDYDPNTFGFGDE